MYMMRKSRKSRESTKQNIEEPKKTTKNLWPVEAGTNFATINPATQAKNRISFFFHNGLINLKNPEMKSRESTKSEIAGVFFSPIFYCSIPRSRDSCELSVSWDLAWHKGP